MGKIKLDDIEKKILDMYIDNTRVQFKDIDKKFHIYALTVNVLVKNMQDPEIIR